MTFNELNRTSSKWRRFSPEVLPMHVAEMDFEVADEIKALLNDMVSRSDVGYLGPIPEVAEAFEQFAKSRWQWQIDKSQLKLATDVGVAAVEILRVLTKPGDKVLVNFPVYSSFQGWIKEVGCEAYNSPLIRDGGTWKLDLAGIEAAFHSGVKVYLLCSPQNPVGRIHTRQELAAVASLARHYGAVVISDEIHAPLSWGQFTPFLALGEDAERVGITITSSSKAFNTAGLKAAFALTQDAELAARIKAVPEAMHWRTSILGAFAMATSFREATGWLDETVARIRENYDFLKEELARQLPKATVADCEATYLAWIDVSAYGVDRPAHRLLETGRVALVAGGEHASSSDYDQFVRFNFATTREHIAEAVARMKLALDS